MSPRHPTSEVTPPPFTYEEERMERVADARTEARIDKHKLDCWGDEGRLGRLGKDVAGIKSWGKGFMIAIVVLQLLNTWQTWASKNGPVPLPIAPAHASPVK